MCELFGGFIPFEIYQVTRPLVDQIYRELEDEGKFLHFLGAIIC